MYTPPPTVNPIPPAAVPSRWARGPIRAIAPAAIYLLLSIALCLNGWLHPGTSYIGNISDPQESMWLHIDGRTTSIPLPWAAVVRLPLLSDVLPVRFMVYFYLLAAVLVAFCVTRLSASGARGPRAALVATAAVTVSFLPLLPHVPLTASTVTLPQFFSSSGDVSRIPVDSTVLTAPFPYRDIVAVSSLVWQAQSGMRYKIVGGYWVGPDPPHTVTPRLERVVTDLGSTGVDEAMPALLPALRGELRAARIGTIVVTPGPYAAREAALFARLLNRAPVHELDVLVWWNVSV